MTELPEVPVRTQPGGTLPSLKGSLVPLGRACQAGVALRHAQAFQAPTVAKTSALLAAADFEGASARWCLSLVGSRGVGKTFAAEWLVYRFLAANPLRGIRLPFVWAPMALLPALIDSDLLRHLLGAPILALDDLGTEYTDRSGRFASLLFEVVNARWRAARKTVITTNLNPKTFCGRYTGLLGDRLSHDASCVVCVGESRRRPPAPPA